MVLININAGNNLFLHIGDKASSICNDCRVHSDILCSPIRLKHETLPIQNFDGRHLLYGKVEGVIFANEHDPLIGNNQIAIVVVTNRSPNRFTTGTSRADGDTFCNTETRSGRLPGITDHLVFVFEGLRRSSINNTFTGLCKKARVMDDGHTDTCLIGSNVSIWVRLIGGCYLLQRLF